MRAAEGHLLAAAHRDLELVLEKPIGEQPEVIAAIAEAIAAHR